jgi:hypothetical protein
LLVGYAQARELPEDRRTLQALGDQLDADQGGAWVANAVRAHAATSPGELLIVDAVRTSSQVEALRSVARVVHVHLTAPLAILQRRYERRRQAAPELEFHSFEQVRENATENNIEQLATDSALVVDTGDLLIHETVGKVVPRIGS